MLNKNMIDKITLDKDRMSSEGMLFFTFLIFIFSSNYDKEPPLLIVFNFFLTLN